MRSVCLGTRGSALALWQTQHVAALLQAAQPDVRVEQQIIKTLGDAIVDRPLPELGGKGVFTAELEAALHAGSIDAAVHSLKDLPTDEPPGLLIAAIPARANPADVLISRGGQTLATLPHGAAVGTGSPRRSAQLQRVRPDLRMLDLRGNVDTRIRKALDPDGPYDAIVIARAGVERLGRLDVVSEVLPLEVVLPAPGQGALAVQCRATPEDAALWRPLTHLPSWLAVAAERTFLAGLGGGCAVPVAAYAIWEDACLRVRGRVLLPDGSQQVEVERTAVLESSDMEGARRLGAELAQDALAHGADRLMEQSA